MPSSTLVGFRAVGEIHVYSLMDMVYPLPWYIPTR